MLPLTVSFRFISLLSNYFRDLLLNLYRESTSPLPDTHNIFVKSVSSVQTYLTVDHREKTCLEKPLHEHFVVVSEERS